MTANATLYGKYHKTKKPMTWAEFREYAAREYGQHDFLWPYAVQLECERLMRQEFFK